MKKLLLTLFACGFVTSAWGKISNNQAEPRKISVIEAFSTMPMINDVDVSPDGKKIAIVKATNKEGDYIVEIRDVERLEKKPIILGSERMLIDRVYWLNNNRIGVSFRQILKDGPYKYWTNKFAVTDSNGKGKWLEPLKKNKIFRF